jgi:hypothetical protein
MLNLDETLYLTDSYTKQKDFYLKSFLYSFGVLIFVDILRNQVSEVNLLQLIPGFYLFFLFSTFFFFLIFSNFFVDIPSFLDRKKIFGTKTIVKLNVSLNFLLSLLLSFFTFALSVITIVPISLDSFNSYGEKTLENIWSFDEVIGLETLLNSALFFFSQLPLILLFFFTTQRDFIFLQKLWGHFSVPSRVGTKNFTTDLVDNAWRPFRINRNLFCTHPGSLFLHFVTT